MELERAGGNCLVITTKKAKLIVDPILSNLKPKAQADQSVVQLLTQPIFAIPMPEDTLTLDCPGEYEILDISIKGIAARAYNDPKTDPMRATMYRIDAGGASLVITGHVFPELSDS